MSPEQSSRRPLVLALSAIAPVLLVALFIAFRGSDESSEPASPARQAAGEVAEVPRTPQALGRAPELRAGQRSSGEGLASLAERQQALSRNAARHDPGFESEGDAEYEEVYEDDGYLAEESDTRRKQRDAPSREEVSALEQLTAAETPSAEELNAMMLDAPPMPTPDEFAELQRRTAELLDTDPDTIRALAEASNAAQPSEERLRELKEEQENYKTSIGEN
jgi:hypothetical protein